MIKGALLLCLAFMAVSSSAVEVGGSKEFPRSQKRYAQCAVGKFSETQETTPGISIPRVNGAWLIEMSRSGGMRPGRETLSINSDGEIVVISEHYKNGLAVTECSLKEKLSTEELQQLKAALRSAKLSKWREKYEDPEHPICCNQPTSRLTIHRLEIAEGDGGGEGTISQSTSWYPGSSKLRPNDLVELSTIAQTLWNNAREHCAK